MTDCSVNNNPALAHALAVWEALAHPGTFDVVGALMELAQPVHGLPFGGATIPEVIGRLELDPADAQGNRKLVDAAARRARAAGLIFSAEIRGTTFYIVAPGTSALYDAWDALTSAMPEPDPLALRTRIARALGSKLSRDILWFLATANEPMSLDAVHQAVRKGFSYGDQAPRVLTPGTGDDDVWTVGQVKGGLESLADARLVKGAGTSRVTWRSAEYHSVRRSDPASMVEALNALADVIPAGRWDTWLRFFKSDRAHRVADLILRGVVITHEAVPETYVGVMTGLGLATSDNASGIDQYSLSFRYDDAMSRLDALGRHVARDIYLTPWTNIAEALSSEGRLQVVAAAASDHRPSSPASISVDRIEEVTGMDRAYIYAVLAQLSLLGLFRRTGPSTCEIHPSLPRLIDASSTAGVNAPSQSFSQRIVEAREKTLG